MKGRLSCIYRGRGVSLVALSACIIVFRLLSFCHCALVDYSKHDLQHATAENFTSKVKVPRNTKSTAVLFAKESDRKIRSLVDDVFNPLATDLKGVLDISVVDCGKDSTAKICELELGENYSTPTFRVYPKNPIPPYNYKGDFVKIKMKRALLKHVPCSAEIVDSKSLPVFLSTLEIMPKVLFFGEAEEPNYHYCALSVEFDKKLYLGYVDGNASKDLVEQYKVKRLPHLLIIKTNGKVDHYSGEFRYGPMFEWLNVYAETFLLGGGYHEDGNGSNAKAYKFDPLPEINLESHMDLCFNKQHGFCIIYLSLGPIDQDTRQTLVDLSNRYKDEFRGKWMWMNLEREKEFSKLFGDPKHDSLVVFNPKAKLRYALVSKDDSKVEREDVVALIEKVLGGDAKFTIVRGGLPKFALPKDEL